jgi:uncharacterized protein (DUF1501 family)
MLTFLQGAKPSKTMCDGIGRRDFLRVGGLGLAGLTMADLLRAKAAQGAAGDKIGHKSVIIIFLPGGPSHLDMYDLKPDAPKEIRGEFNPIKTNVPGIDICELMPRQAKIADKYAIVRGVQSVDTHSAYTMMTGYSGGMKRPVFGSIVSKIMGSGGNGMPPYVALGGENSSDPGTPEYLGAAHRPFNSGGQGLSNLGVQPGMTLDRLNDRKALLSGLDNLRRDMDDARGTLAGVDAFTARALDMITTNRVRDAFDVNKEPEKNRERYGRTAGRFVLARRLAEAGVSCVTLSCGGTIVPGADWDTHGKNDGRTETNWENLRRKLPVYDQAVAALISDIHEKGLEKQIAVAVFGEFGRTPRINKDGGRDHWAPAGFVLFSGGGLKSGLVVGDTGRTGDRSTGRIYTAQNVLSTLYHVLGIDPETTLPDHFGRPIYLLDEREPIAELV